MGRGVDRPWPTAADLVHTRSSEHTRTSQHPRTSESLDDCLAASDTRVGSPNEVGGERRTRTLLERLRRTATAQAWRGSRRCKMSVCDCLHHLPGEEELKRRHADRAAESKRYKSAWLNFPLPVHTTGAAR